MEELESAIGPGTAGLTQRISSKYASKAKDKEKKLYVVEYNRLSPCGQNQY